MKTIFITLTTFALALARPQESTITANEPIMSPQQGGQGQGQPQVSIADYISQSPNHRVLAQILNATGFMDSLSGPISSGSESFGGQSSQESSQFSSQRGQGAVTAATSQQLTFFAPTDRAFASMPRPLLQALASDPNMFSAVFLYHLSSAPVTPNVLQQSSGTMAVPTLLEGFNIVLSRGQQGGQESGQQGMGGQQQGQFQGQQPLRGQLQQGSQYGRQQQGSQFGQEGILTRRSPEEEGSSRRQGRQQQQGGETSQQGVQIYRVQQGSIFVNQMAGVTQLARCSNGVVIDIDRVLSPLTGCLNLQSCSSLRGGEGATSGGGMQGGRQGQVFPQQGQQGQQQMFPQQGQTSGRFGQQGFAQGSQGSY